MVKQKACLDFFIEFLVRGRDLKLRCTYLVRYLWNYPNGAVHIADPKPTEFGIFHRFEIWGDMCSVVHMESRMNEHSLFDD